MAFRISIARSCAASFAEMRGDETKRFCESCEKHVRDLSEGTEEEARALFAANPGARICVRVAREPNGAVHFRGAAIATAISLAACSPHAGDHAARAPHASTQNDTGALEREMGDGIPDADDRCPAEPEGVDDPDGCPTTTIDAGK